MSDKPNPGSLEAISAGCKCPVLDNNHGTRAPFPPDSWWIEADCPVHAKLEPAPGQLDVFGGEFSG